MLLIARVQSVPAFLAAPTHPTRDLFLVYGSVIQQSLIFSVRETAPGVYSLRSTPTSTTLQYAYASVRLCVSRVVTISSPRDTTTASHHHDLSTGRAAPSKAIRPLQADGVARRDGRDLALSVALRKVAEELHHV